MYFKVNSDRTYLGAFPWVIGQTRDLCPSTIGAGRIFEITLWV